MRKLRQYYIPLNTPPIKETSIIIRKQLVF